MDYIHGYLHIFIIYTYTYIYPFIHICIGKQVRLPASLKEAGPDVKESGLFSGASNLEDGGRGAHVLKPITWEDGGLMSQSPSPPLSGGRGFYNEGEENRAKRSREGVEEFSMCRRAQCIPIRQVMVRRASAWLSHPAPCHPGSSMKGYQISWKWDA